MDTFAAFALSTEPPIDAVVAGEPYKEDTKVLTGVIWRQVLGISAWNVLVMTFSMTFGYWLGGFDYKYSTTINDSGLESGEPQSKQKHMTMLYNTFIFLQLFNEINCRKIGAVDYNVFENIHKNFYFIAVVGGTFTAQFVMGENFSGILFPTCSLSKGEWGACVAAGATPLVIAVLLKATTRFCGWIERVDTSRFVDENKRTEASGLVKKFQEVKKVKVDKVDYKNMKEKGLTPSGEDNNFMRA